MNNFFIWLFVAGSTHTTFMCVSVCVCLCVGKPMHTISSYLMLDLSHYGKIYIFTFLDEDMLAFFSATDISDIIVILLYSYAWDVKWKERSSQEDMIALLKNQNESFWIERNKAVFSWGHPA